MIREEELSEKVVYCFRDRVRRSLRFDALVEARQELRQKCKKRWHACGHGQVAAAMVIDCRFSSPVFPPCFIITGKSNRMRGEIKRMQQRRLLCVQICPKV